MHVSRAQSAAAHSIQKEPVCDRIQEAALQSFKELSIAFGCNILISSFVATPPGLSLMISMSFVQMAASFLFHSASAFSGAPNLFDWLKSANFAIFTGYNIQTLLHEMGHTLAALALYKNSKPTIELHPFIGGITQFYKTRLSSLGNQIGPAATTCLVVASGPGFALLISSALLWVGLELKENHPKLSKYLISWSLFDFLHHAYYSYSAIHADAWNLSHDFVHLSVFGANPIVITIGIVAIPSIFFGLKFKHRCDGKAM